MALCSQCSSLNLKSLITSDYPACYNHDFQHARIINLLRTAKGCALCALFLEALAGTGGEPSSGGQFSPLALGGPLQKHHAELLLNIKHDPPELVFPYLRKVGLCLTGLSVRTSLSDVTGRSVRLFTYADGTAGYPGIIGRPRLSNSGSPEAFKLLRRWISGCREQHAQCFQTFAGVSIDTHQNPELPKRVIDVGGNGNGSQPIKVLGTRGMRAKYTAMTHCWGNAAAKSPIVSVQSNIARRCHAIEWDELPRSFQDAVIVTREVGIRFLWIDSLCIVQDDHSEWLQESVKMGTIYEQAELTIAASHACDSHQGLFFPRSEPPPVVELPSFLGSDHLTRVYATTVRDTKEDLYPEHGALNQRAWATQEWLLARRMVFYTKAQMIWSCKTVTQRETGEKCFNTARNPKWKIIVEHYSDRKLTMPTDKLIALEGVRTEFEKRTGNTYLFGIWKQSLPDELLWAVCEKSDQRVPLDLPSWTWATVSVGVRFLPMHRARNLCHYIRPGSDNAIIMKSWIRPIEVTQGWLYAPHSNRKDVQSHGFQSFLRIQSEMELSNIKNITSLADRLYNNGELTGWAVFDCPSLPKPASPVYGLTLMGTMSRKDECSHLTTYIRSKKLRVYWLLLVQQLTEESNYIRVGVGKVFSKTWLVDATIEEITIT
ncbi:HET-domain-containing protein [Tothia fuscella]|uniref:HET-domain-containing protein n=1 Tax=Tothia fuscella TaxID=1048955 RepID=A0A9P4U233_9PEZI|nr:HET-domain-containing protein [Tothia fuscella]